MRTALVFACLLVATPAFANFGIEKKVIALADPTGSMNKLDVLMYVPNVTSCMKSAGTVTIDTTLEAGKATKMTVKAADNQTRNCVEKAFVGATWKDSKSKVTATIELVVFERTKPMDEPGAKEVRMPTPPRAGLTSDQVFQVVAPKQAAVRACYDQELRRTPKLSGKFLYEFDIAPAGTIDAVRAKKPTKQTVTLDTCIINQLKTLRFPVSTTKTTVAYPFVFKPATPRG